MNNITFTDITFGCKVNTYETEAIREEMEKAGFIYREEMPADIVFVNTCAVTLVAENKAKEKIRSLGRNYPSSHIMVLGCFAQLHPTEIKGLEGVDLVIGTKDRKNVVKLVRDYLENGKEEVLVNPNSRLFDYESISISRFEEEARAFVKIQDGCDNFCAYCVIPLTRGKSRSRKEKEILEECQRLVNNSYREIVLTGIDIGSYKDGEKTLADLVYDILHEVKGDFRLRISSLEMSQIDERYIELYKTEKKLVPHIHIPLQSGSEAVLEAMNRKYDLHHFLEVTKILKKEIPDVALSTDIITGFPNESEENFKETMEFTKKVGFMRLHVFPYSRRPYTKADKMKGQLANAVKKERARRLIALGNELAEEYFKNNVGTIHEVLIEEKLCEEEGYSVYRGYTENYLDVRVKSKGNLLNKFVKGHLNADGTLNEEEVR